MDQPLLPFLMPDEARRAAQYLVDNQPLDSVLYTVNPYWLAVHLLQDAA